MESREYGISTPGSDGEYGGQVRKEQYSDDRMDGHDLHQSGNGLYFRPSGAIFVSYVKRERRICYQSDHGRLAKATDYCGVRSGKDVDKWKEAHLTPAKAEKLRYAPVIEECPVNIECKVTEVKELGSHHMFLAEVLAVQIDEQYLNEKNKFELNKTGLMAYSHGEYLSLGKKIGTFGYSVKKKKTKHKKKKK